MSLALTVSSLSAEFWPFPNLDSLDRKAKETFEARFQERDASPISFQNDFIGFQEIGFTETYRDLVNLVLHWKISQDEKSLSELRERINALCSYEKWGDVEKKHSDLNRAFPSILLSLAYSWMRADLPPTELHALENRMYVALRRYWDEFQDPSTTSWAKYLNHPHYTMHLTAMYALSYSVLNRDSALASEVMHHTRKSYTKFFRMMSDTKDGSLAQGLSLGSLNELGILLYLENEAAEGRTKESELPWLKARLPFYKLSILPGQKELLKMGLGEGKPLVPIAPILWHWAKVFEDKELQYLADNSDRDMDEKWSAWSFLRVLFCKEKKETYWNDEMETGYLEEAGVWTARSGRRVQSSQIGFHCGNPLGASVYQKVVEGYPHLNLNSSTPAQGAFSWYRQGRHVFSFPDGEARDKTQNYNTLLVNDAGQVFEGYPAVLPESLIKTPVAGRLLENLRFGDSLLVRGEFANCYPNNLSVEKFDRTLIWLGESILVLVDQIKVSKESKLSLVHRSIDFEFLAEEFGFSQKLSGLEMKTWSEPAGEWSVGKDMNGNKGNSHFFAVHHVNAKEWMRISVMAPPAWLGDFRTEHSDIKHVVDFSMGGYKVELSPKAGFDESWLKVVVRNKTFFDLKK